MALEGYTFFLVVLSFLKKIRLQGLPVMLPDSSKLSQMSAFVPLSLPTTISVPTKTVKMKTGNAILSLKLELRTPL